MGPEIEHWQCLPAFYCTECQHMGEERADGCTAAERLWC